MNIIANNKKANFDYFLSDFIEAGVALEGSEVKSIRLGGISLSDSFVFVDTSGEVWLKNVYIKPYEKTANYISDSKRSRKLLLSKLEIRKLLQKTKEKGFSIIPTKVYIKNNIVKVEIALAKGKKLFDKRETLKEKSQKMEIERAKKDFTKK